MDHHRTRLLVLSFAVTHGGIRTGTRVKRYAAPTGVGDTLPHLEVLLFVGDATQRLTKHDNGGLQGRQVLCSIQIGSETVARKRETGDDTGPCLATSFACSALPTAIENVRCLAVTVDMIL